MTLTDWIGLGLGVATVIAGGIMHIQSVVRSAISEERERSIAMFAPLAGYSELRAEIAALSRSIDTLNRQLEGMGDNGR